MTIASLHDFQFEYSERASFIKLENHKVEIEHGLLYVNPDDWSENVKNGNIFYQYAAAAAEHLLVASSKNPHQTYLSSFIPFPQKEKLKFFRLFFHSNFHKTLESPRSQIAFAYAVYREIAFLSADIQDVLSFYNYAMESFSELRTCTKEYFALEIDMMRVLRRPDGAWKSFVAMHPELLLKLATWYDRRIRYASAFKFRIHAWMFRVKRFIWKTNKWRLLKEAHLTGAYLEFIELLRSIKSNEKKPSKIHDLWQETEATLEELESHQLARNSPKTVTLLSHSRGAFFGISIVFLIMLTVSIFLGRLGLFGDHFIQLIEMANRFIRAYSGVAAVVALLFLAALWSRSRLSEYWKSQIVGGVSAGLAFALSLIPRLNQSIESDYLILLYIVLTLLILFALCSFVLSLTKVSRSLILSLERIGSFVGVQLILYVSLVGMVTGLLFNFSTEYLQSEGLFSFAVPDLEGPHLVISLPMVILLSQLGLWASIQSSISTFQEIFMAPPSPCGWPGSDAPC